MSHYEERLEADLATIRQRVDGVAKRVQVALRDATHALLTLDHDLASRTIIGDRWVNRQTRGIDRLCHSFVARHLPGAGHLRFVSSVLRVDIAMERIGDYAVGVCREAVQLSEGLPQAIARDIEIVSEQSIRMLELAVKAFRDANAEMARGTMGMATQLGLTFDRVFRDLLEEAEARSRPARDLFAMLIVLNRIDRVRDQAKNICEEAVFVATGETKQPKVSRILFLDERDDCLTQMAAAYARKAFPDYGEFASAGWAPAGEFAGEFVAFMDGEGLGLPDSGPTPFDATPGELGEIHVIIGLGTGARAQIPDLPFHTVFLDWQLEIPDRSDPEALRSARQDLCTRIAELMKALRGGEDGID